MDELTIWGRAPLLDICQPGTSRLSGEILEFSAQLEDDGHSYPFELCPKLASSEMYSANTEAHSEAKRRKFMMRGVRVVRVG